MRLYFAIPSRRPLCGFAVVVLTALCLPGQEELAPDREPAPFSFVANHGQWPASVGFRLQSGAATAWFDSDGWVLGLEQAGRHSDTAVPVGSQFAESERGMALALRMSFAGSRGARVTGESVLPTRYHFCRGSDRTRWVRDARAYRSLRYERLYPGVDLVVREHRGRLEYDMHLASGARLADVVVRCEGVDGLRMESDGTLVMETALGPVTQTAPRTWVVEGDGTHRPLASSFRVMGPDRYSFAVPGWDGATALVIDPGIGWAAFVGGSGTERAMALDLDGSDRVVVVGQTSSPDFPTTFGTYQGGNDDAFVTLIDPAQSGPASGVWSILLGGAGDEIAFDVEYAASQSRFTVVGITSSTGFPTTSGSLQPSFRGVRDGYVTQLDAMGNIVYSTFLGTSRHERIGAVEVDAQTGIVTVGGFTNSDAFPTTAGAFQSTRGGSLDAFVARLDPARAGAAQLVSSTYLGGSGEEGIWLQSRSARNWDAIDLHVATNGDVTVASRTRSVDFPVTSRAFQPSWRGGINADMFVVRLDASLSALLYATYLGSTEDDAPFRIAVDDAGVITLGGVAWGADFWTTPGAFDRTSGGSADGVIARLDPAKTPGSQLVYATYIGGNSIDTVWGLLVEPSGIVVACGSTRSGSGLQGTSGAAQPSYLPNGTGFALRLEPAGKAAADMHYLSFVGAGAIKTGGWELCVDLVLMRDGRAAVAAVTDNPGLATMGSQASFGGGAADAVVAILDLLPVHAVRFGQATPPCRPSAYTQVNSDPAPGNASFELFCHQAPAGAAGVLFIGQAAPAGIPVLGLTVHTVPWLDVAVSTNSEGVARIRLPMPARVPRPTSVALQWIWLDPAGCGTGLSASEGLELQLLPPPLPPSCCEGD